MPAAAAIIGGASIVGGVGQAVAGAAAAGAQERAGAAQLAAAEEARREALQAAEPTAQQLAEINKSIELRDRVIQREEQLLQAIDPALIESGQQALRLLRGEEAPTLAPLRRQQQRQRAQLESRLRESLGPGFATSTAGREALNRFDQGAADQLLGAQQQTLGGLLGIATGARPQAGAVLQAAGAPLRQLGAIQTRQIQAAIGAQRPAAFAGAPFAGEVTRAQTIGNIFGGIGAAGGTIGILSALGAFPATQRQPTGVTGGGTTTLGFGTREREPGGF